MEVFSTDVDNLRMVKALEKLIPRESRREKVGPRISAVREVLGLTKAEFADSVDLDRSSLTKIEKGEAGLDIVVAERIFHIYGFGLNFIYANDFTDVPRDLHAALMERMAKSGR